MIIEKLRHELEAYRERYKSLLDEIGGDDCHKGRDVEAAYAGLWEDPDAGREELDILHGLLIRIEQALVVRSADAGRDDRLLAAYRELPFVVHGEEYIRHDPFLTLDSLDALIALLGKTASPSSPTTAKQDGRSASLSPTPDDPNRRAFLASVRKRLKVARGDRTVEQFAKALAISQTVIYKLPKGDLRCSLEKLDMIAEEIGCSRGELYREEFDHIKHPPVEAPHLQRR